MSEMMSDPKLLILMVAGLFVGYLIYKVIVAVVRGAAHAVRRKHINKMKDALRATGVRIIGNDDKEVMAICHKDAFVEVLGSYFNGVKFGDPKSLEKPTCWVRKTLTFSSNEHTQRFVHTGTKQELEAAFHTFVLNVTGVEPYSLSKREYDEVVGVIFLRDSRLFVPFSGNVPNAEKQVEFYGPTSLDDLNKLLAS